MIAIIAAVAAGGAIGRGGDLVYHISADLKRFKELTMGNVILMGRKTFESLPKRPLPGRENVVITRNPDYHPVGVTVFTDVEEALKTLTAEGKNVFVIGGGEIYRQTIDFADRLYITHIDAEAQDADTFFPDVEKSKWEIANVSETNTDPKTGVNYSFIDYIRR